jgi:hypothetical protein
MYFRKLRTLFQNCVCMLYLTEIKKETMTERLNLNADI